MPSMLLIPGLVCDQHVWAATQRTIAGATVADVTTQSTISHMAQDLLDRHAGGLVVAGHSLGGRVAMEMANIAPGRITGMALLNTGMHPLRDGEMAARQVMIDLAHREGMAALAACWLPGMMAEGMPTDPSVMAGLTDMVSRQSADVHERQMRALMKRPDASATLSSYRGSLLLMVGRQDHWSPIAQHRDIARLCPQARLEIIDNAGHFAPVEQPEVVARLLADWAAPLLKG